MNWRVLKDQPYGVVIEPLIRGSVDAVRQHCPAKRLTPMGLLADKSARFLPISSMKSGILICILNGSAVIIGRGYARIL